MSALDAEYRAGWMNGESAVLEQWERGLDGALPDNVEVTPIAVATHIRELRAERDTLREILEGIMKGADS